MENQNAAASTPPEGQPSLVVKLLTDMKAFLVKYKKYIPSNFRFTESSL
jgi:hypothetical protein